MTDVWVTYEARGECDCWRDAVCAHGWTWQEDGDDEPCQHVDGYEAVHESFADAVRALFSLEGPEAIGPMLRVRFAKGSPFPWKTHRVFIMRPGTLIIDDHKAEGGPNPWRIIQREQFQPRSTPRHDLGMQREFASQYR